MKEDTDGKMSMAVNSSHLAEPPYVRERLIQEIKFFISHLRSRTSGSGLSAVSGSDKPHLLQYVTFGADEAEMKGAGPISGRSSGGGSRPHSTISSRDGR